MIASSMFSALSAAGGVAVSSGAAVFATGLICCAWAAHVPQAPDCCFATARLHRQDVMLATGCGPLLTIGQNLVPLVLRPLRLFVSAETLRTWRIVLLKATHWPFVGLILFWERARLQWQQKGVPATSFGSTKRSLNASMRRRPVSGQSFKHPLLADGGIDPPLDQEARADRRADVEPSGNTSAAFETIEALEKAVQDLKAQAENLANLLVQAKAAQRNAA